MFSTDSCLMKDSAPNRACGLQRLETFVPNAGRDYARNRNSDHGPERRDNVSVLSPWIRYRIITESEVLVRVLEAHSATAAEKFIQEVLWRTYWKGWLDQRPAVWHQYVVECDQARETVQSSPDLERRLEAAVGGRTGIEGFDDWAQELTRTGYLHNHARMWFASIWIFTLKLPWVLGADFFLRHLLDGDPASNTLSWRWVAGLQTPGKTYLARPDNIEKFTDGRFRPKGLATRAEALKGAPLPSPAPLPPAVDEPSADLTDQLLLIHPEDLHPESLISTCGRPSLMLLLEPEAFLPHWPWGDKAKRFVSGACDDLAGRMEQGGHGPVQRLESIDAESIAAAVTKAGREQLFTPVAAVGPVADALKQLEKDLDREGIQLVSIRRDWDQAAWPLATRGFFPFRKHIPKLLARAGLG